MLVHRIAQTQYINDLSGEGARRYGGRWNRPGVPVLYTAQHLSLAVLELIVHFDAKEAFMQPYSYVSLDVPADLLLELKDTSFDLKMLKANSETLWATLDYHFMNDDIIGIVVPSVIIPTESNVILNPLHQDYKAIKVLETASLNLDQRLANLVP